MPEQPRKSKRERFLIVAEKRTIRILKIIRLLGNCGNRAAYEYSNDDVEKIFGAIQSELDRAQERFSTRPGVHFSLRTGENQTKGGK